MQVLKQKIREEILKVAERLFFEYGFSGTSTRNIAKEVGISVSNLYKYFTDKQAIFSAVIEPFYKDSKADLAAIFSVEHTETDPDIDDIIIRKIMNMMMTDRHKFVILVSRSEETKYANVKEEMINMMFNHLAESINHEAVRDVFILQVLAANFIEGILKIAERYHDDPPSITDNINAFVHYHMAGIAQFLSE